MKQLKGVFLGDYNAGKTSLVQRLFDNEFRVTQSTIGVEFRSGVLVPNLKISIWDTAGSEYYRSIVPMYFRNVDFIVVVLDKTDSNIMETYTYWMRMIDKHALPTVPVQVLLNKYDLTAPSQQWEKVPHTILVSAKVDTNTVLLNKLWNFWEGIHATAPPRTTIAVSKPRETMYTCC